MTPNSQESSVGSHIGFMQFRRTLSAFEKRLFRSARASKLRAKSSQRRLRLESLDQRRLLAADLLWQASEVSASPMDDSPMHQPTWQERVAYVAQQVAGSEYYFVDEHGNVRAETPNVPSAPPEEKDDGDSAESDSGFTTQSPPYPYSQTFLLNSFPSSKHTIYLDFNGHTTTGTLWNSQITSGAAIVTPPFSFEGDNSFSNAELQRIQQIWERVAEDFRPFNVNVTTQEPPLHRLMRTGEFDEEWGIRVVIGPDTWYPGTFGGVAYVGSFNWSNDTPTFVFSDHLSNNEKFIAEAISHEVGHTLGLFHDGTSSVEYYAGHGTGPTGWAPIMGVGYSRELVQWSKGEYPGANNTQDDILVIVFTGGNGLSYRNDDHGNTRATATPLSISPTSWTASASGIIERSTDIDYFSFTTSGGEVSFLLNPFYRSPNLDILARLYNSSGTVIATSNPISTLDASFNLNLASGSYFLSIEGTGKAASGSDHGYSDYASLGAYTVFATIPPNLPDLVGWWADVQASELKWGQSFQVRGQVRNLGGLATSTPFYQDFFLSKNQVWGDSDDILLGWHWHTAPVPAFGFGPEFFITLTLPAEPPAGYPGAGTLYIGMMSDALNHIIELNETNNGPGDFAQTYDWDSFVAPPPDLVGGWTEILQPGKSMDSESEDSKEDRNAKQGEPVPSVVLNWGDSFQVKAQVGNFNIDTWVTAPFFQDFILSSNLQWGDEDDVLLDWFDHVDRVWIVGPIHYVTLTLPSSPPPGFEGQGPFYIGMKTDALNEIAETDETNNGPGWWGNARTFDWDWFLIQEATPATIADQFVYHSSYTGSGSAVDSSKVVAREGTAPQTLSYQNLINTSDGINGLVLDINDLASTSLTASDFVFQMSPLGLFDEASNPPSSWTTAPSPSSITVTSGSPSRLLLQWPNNTIQNRWLRVTVLANDNTGLQQDEVFYIGHLLGETTGESGGSYAVSFGDISPIRNALGNTVDVTSPVDIDKNGQVTFGDISAMRPYVGLNLRNITIPAASSGGGGGGGSGAAQSISSNQGASDDRIHGSLTTENWLDHRLGSVALPLLDRLEGRQSRSVTSDQQVDLDWTFGSSSNPLTNDDHDGKRSARRWLFGSMNDQTWDATKDGSLREDPTESLQLVDEFFATLV